MKRKNFIFPSFYIKGNHEGIYSSTYPACLTDFNFSFNDAINEWQFWHPDTKILFTSNIYLSKLDTSGQPNRKHLKNNINRLSISKNPNDQYSENYKFTVIPITFLNNSKDGISPYYSEYDQLVTGPLNLYESKLIWFSTNQTTLDQGSIRALEYIEWWEEKGRNNFQAFIDYKYERERNEPPEDNPYKESDSWMDDPENYWSIDLL